MRIARKARLGYDDFLYISQQARKKLGLRRGRKERRLPQLLADADLKRFFRAIQDCGDVQHETLLKLLFYTAVRVSELVHIEVGDSPDTLISMVAAGRGVFVGPQIGAEGRTAAIDFYPLTEAEIQFELFAIWKKQSQIDPTISKFIEVLQESIKPV